MIKILITDDSATETALLKHIFEAEKDMKVIGCAQNGKEAVKLAAKLKPDLITMDIQMPLMDGYEATRSILMNNPVPIVVISQTVNQKELNTTFLALEAGAVSVIEKPNIADPDFSFARKRIIDTIRAMSEIQVIKQRFSKSHPRQDEAKPWHNDAPHAAYEIIGIGASVGGPQALKQILSALPADFPVPIVVVQHMTLGFMQGFCDWLNEYSALRIKCIENLEALQAGTVYFAAENHHFLIKRNNKHLIGYWQEGPAISGFCPSISLLFQSIAKACGKQAIGILLTGMGQDGAQGLLELKEKKALTLIQSEKSSVVFGMAAVAQSLGAVDKVIELDDFVSYLCQLFP